MDSSETEDDFFSTADEGSKIPDTDALMTVVDMPQNDHLEDDLESDSGAGSDDEDLTLAIGDRDEDGRVHGSNSVMKRGPNGQRPIDLTPPDVLLHRTEKRVAKSVANKEMDNVIPDLIRCCALARLVHSERHWRLARTHVKLASAYLDLKGYSAQAVYHVEIAENIVRNQEGSQANEYSTDQPLIYATLVEMYFTLGRALTTEKKFSDAEVALTQAEKILRELSAMPSVLDTDLEDWSMKLNLAIGRLNFSLKKHAVSLTYFEQALDVMQKKYGNNSSQLISVYQSLGRVEQGKGKQADHQRAIEYFLQAHSIAVSNFSDDGVEVAETAYAVALAYANVGDEDAENSAEIYLNQALTTYESHYGSGNEKVMEIRDELARLMIRTDRVEDAIALLQSTVEQKQDTYGDLSTHVADTWKLIGNCYLSTGDTGRALQVLKKCHSIESAVLGANSRKAKETQKTIDMLLANPNLAAKQKKSKAEELRDRPRFSSVARTTTALGGYKPQL